MQGGIWEGLKGDWSGRTKERGLGMGTLGSFYLLPHHSVRGAQAWPGAVHTPSPSVPPTT